MSDYTWIKPGVRGRIIQPKGFNDNTKGDVGKIVTISSSPYNAFSSLHPPQKICDIELNGECKRCHCEALEPVEDDDRKDDVPDWIEIIKGNGSELPDYTPPLKVSDN